MHPYIKAWILIQHAKSLLVSRRVNETTKAQLRSWIVRKQQFMEELTC